MAGTHEYTQAWGTGKGVQKGAVGNRESCVVATREKRHKDPKPCRQNPAVQNRKADSLNNRQGQQNVGLWEQGPGMLPPLVPLG